jgi:hypothetical protein
MRRHVSHPLTAFHISSPPWPSTGKRLVSHSSNWLLLCRFRSRLFKTFLWKFPVPLSVLPAFFIEIWWIFFASAYNNQKFLILRYKRAIEISPSRTANAINRIIKKIGWVRRKVENCSVRRRNKSSINHKQRLSSLRRMILLKFCA